MIKHCFSKDSRWIRFGPWLLHWKRSPPLFSERYGYQKFYKIPFTEWRIRLDHEQPKEHEE